MDPNTARRNKIWKTRRRFVTTLGLNSTSQIFLQSIGKMSSSYSYVTIKWGELPTQISFATER